MVTRRRKKRRGRGARRRFRRSRRRRRRRQRGGNPPEGTEIDEVVKVASVPKYPDNTQPGMPRKKPRGEMPFDPHGGSATGDARSAGGSRRRSRRRRRRGSGKSSKRRRRTRAKPWSPRSKTPPKTPTPPRIAGRRTRKPKSKTRV